jgi:hypothetical protein
MLQYQGGACTCTVHTPRSTSAHSRACRASTVTQPLTPTILSASRPYTALILKGDSPDGITSQSTVEKDSARRSGECTIVAKSARLPHPASHTPLHVSVGCSTSNIRRKERTSSRPTTLHRSAFQAKNVNAFGRFSGERDLWLAVNPSPDSVADA